MSLSAAQPVENEAIKNLAQTTAWKKLLHYQKTFFGREKSIVDGPGFFFSPRGSVDPEAEMLATLAAMDSTTQAVGIHKLQPQRLHTRRFQLLIVF